MLSGHFSLLSRSLFSALGELLSSFFLNKMADQLDIFLVVQNGHILVLKAEEIGGRACRFDVLSSRPPSFHNFERTALARLYLVRKISSSDRAKRQGLLADPNRGRRKKVS